MTKTELAALREHLARMWDKIDIMERKFERVTDEYLEQEELVNIEELELIGGGHE